MLGRAAAEDRIVLTHDVSTLIATAFERIMAGMAMPGVIAVAQSTPIGIAIEDLILVAECAMPEDVRNRVLYLPLR